jgi:prepilin-type N-terminal cleavage/methylation domain-containing protein
MRFRRGFTLIELLVVIAIIGLLSSIVLTALDASRARARDAVRLSDLKQMQTALALYYNDNGQYPPYRAFTADADMCGTNWCALETALAPYLPSIVYDPLYPDGSNQFRYRYEANSDDGYNTYGFMVVMESPSNFHLAANDGGSPEFAGAGNGSAVEIGEQPPYCNTTYAGDWWNVGSQVCDDGN